MAAMAIRKFGPVIMFAALLAGAEGSRQLIENADKPSNPMAGRVLELREELRITDEGGQFFFQHPHNIKVAPDGSHIVSDQDELIRFDPNGVFLRNYFKKGQGPGELSYVDNFGFDGDLLLVHNNNPNKFVWFSFDGTLVDELRLHDISRLDFEFYRDGVFYGFRAGMVNTKGRMEIVDIPHILLAVSRDGTSLKELGSFPIQVLMAGGAWASATGLIAVPFRERHMFVSHTPEYLVRLCDIQTGEVLRSFNRKYKRIRRPEESGGAAIFIDGKRHRPPGSEYLNDVSDLFVFKDALWVLTSIKDDRKGFLVDVFDFEGRYVDAFYLDIEGRPIGTHGDCVFVREQDEDGLISVVKFRVVVD
jgi:hypothetical protein